MPCVCPYSADDSAVCRIGLNHRRARLTGPRFPLDVVACSGHRRAFTVHPLGHFAYGREAMAVISLDGAAVAPPPELTASPHEQTFFKAAADAALGQAWLREPNGGTDTWWQTQRRRVARAVHLCGVAPNLAQTDRLALAEAWQVPAQVLTDAAQSIADAPGYRSRGKGVVTVLTEAGPDEPLEYLRRLLRAGHLAGLWGPAYFWDSGARALRRWAFPAAGTRPP